MPKLRPSRWPFPLACAVAGALVAGTAAGQTRVQPILGFPEAGLDDPAAYQGYQTRFFRDTKGNVVQIYLDARSGRVVNLLADAIDESVGFTVRDGNGKPIRLEWGSPDATISQVGNRRTIEYQLIANTPQLLIGWILLGSMRVERDLGYSGRGLEPYDWPTFRLREEEELISNLDRLDPAERQRQIGMLGTGFTADLRARLEPDLLTTGVRGTRGVSAMQTSLDGKTNLQLDLVPDPNTASIVVNLPVVSVRATGTQPIRFTVRVTTDGPSLNPLTRDQIFNAAFLRFLTDARTAADRARGNASRNPADAARVLPLGVLRVVEEEIGAGRDGPTGDPFRAVVERGGQVRLMIGHVGEHTTPVLDPVAERGASMLDHLGLDDCAADAPRFARHILEDGLGRRFREADREEGW